MSVSTIAKLENPKSKRRFLLQKKVKKNEGEVPQYYVEGNHEAIITPAVFDLVQAEIAKRVKGRTRHSGVSIFSGKIKCADCGGWYGSKVWNSKDKYRRLIYRCNNKYDGKKCETPHVTEEEIKAAFLSALNKLTTEKREIIANVKVLLRTVCATEALKEEKGRLASEMSVLVEMMDKEDKENARLAQDQAEFLKRRSGLVARYEEAKDRHDKVGKAIIAKEMHRAELENFIEILKSQDGVTQKFDGRLWGDLVKFVTVGRNKEITVTFKDGTEMMA